MSSVVNILAAIWGAASRGGHCKNMHTHIATCRDFKRTACGGLSWALRTDLWLLISSHDTSMWSSTILHNNELINKAYVWHLGGKATFAAAEVIHSLSEIKNPLCVVLKSKNFHQDVSGIKCANRFRKDFKTAVQQI